MQRYGFLAQGEWLLGGAACFASCSTWNVRLSAFLFLAWGVFLDIVFHVEQAFDGDVFVRARAYAYYGVVFRFLNVGDVVWLGGLHE